MNQTLQNKLFEKYPRIFGQKDEDPTRTAMCWGISCGDGWYNIIDNLCYLIQRHHDNPREELERYHKYLEASVEKNEEDNIEFWTNKIEEAKQLIENRPQTQAVQVKEKFGTLRFYVDNVDPEIDAYVSFAENMSGCTCEKCGSPATQNESGWIKTECSKCKGEI